MSGHVEEEKESLLTSPKRLPDSNQGRGHKVPRRASSLRSPGNAATLSDGGQSPLQGFQFVQVDSSGRPQNADLKTAVRSNARRHTQKERQRPKAGAGPRPLAIKQIRPVQLRPQSQQAMQSDPDFGGPPMKDIDKKQGNDPSGSQSYDEVSSSTFGRGGKDFGEDSSYHVAIGKIVHERPSSNFLLSQNPSGLSGTFFGGIRNNQLPQFDRWQNLNHEANTPYALTLGAGAPMLYMEANRWPFPFQVRGEEQPKVSFWMPESGTSIPDAGVPRGPLTKTISPTIRWVSDRLAIPNEGTSDTTIGVIICLTMWEIARSDNLEAVQHMIGVEKIIKLRGGIDALSDNLDFQLKILLVDLYTSIVSNTSPRLPNLNRKEPLEPPRKILGLDVNAILDSPLYRHRPQHRLDNVTVGPPFDQTSIRLLQIMRTLTLQPSISVKTALLSEAGTIFQTQEVNTNMCPLFKTILHASLIYSRAFHVEPIHFSSPINHNSLDVLIQELECEVNDEIWLRYPGVFLWVLLTATIAADGRPERAFLTHLFGRIVPVAKWGWWNEIRASMLTFLDVKRMAEARISEVQ